MRCLRFVIFFLATVTLVPIFIVVGRLPTRRRYAVSNTILRWHCRAMLRLLRIHVSESPGELGDAKPRVIISNHVSYLDIYVLFARRVPCVFLGKQEVGRWPIVATVAKAAGVVFVDRTSLWGRARAILSVQERLRDGISVVIFPEGTTTLTGPERGLSTWFAGAFRVSRMEDSEIETLYLDYDNVEHVAWVGADTFVRHLWAFLGTEGASVRIRHSLQPAVQDRRDQRERFHETREWMLEAGAPLSVDA